MGKHSVRKKCVECKVARNGTPNRVEWCDHCGGEMRPIPYGNRRKKRATGKVGR